MKLLFITLALLIVCVISQSTTITTDITTIYGTIPDYTKACTVDMDCNEADSYCCAYSTTQGSTIEGYACGRYTKQYISGTEGGTLTGGQWFQCPSIPNASVPDYTAACKRSVDCTNPIANCCPALDAQNTTTTLGVEKVKVCGLMTASGT